MTRSIVPLLAAVLLAACGKPVEEQAKEVDQGRAETRHLESVDSIGYAGSGVRKKVDRALDANDERTGTLDEAIEKDSQ